jgi:hypothetical protein
MDKASQTIMKYKSKLISTSTFSSCSFSKVGHSLILDVVWRHSDDRLPGRFLGALWSVRWRVHLPLHPGLSSGGSL